MTEATELRCAHCSGPHPYREDPDNAMCSTLCAIDSGGYVEGASTSEIVEGYVDDLRRKLTDVDDEDELQRYSEGIARLLKWLVHPPTLVDAPRADPLLAALDAYLDGAPT